MRVLGFVLAPICLAAIACANPSDDQTGESQGAQIDAPAAGTIDTSGVLAVSVELVPTHTAMPYPPPAGWDCFTESGKFTVDLAASKFYGESCRLKVVPGSATLVRRSTKYERALSAAELQQVVDALGEVEKTTAVVECRTDAEPYMALHVKSSKEESAYVDQSMSCDAERGTPVTQGSLGMLYGTIEALSIGH